MAIRLLAALWLTLLVSCGVAFADVLPSKVEAVKQYLLKDDYPEQFGDKSYRVKVKNILVADIDDDGEDEVVFHVTPHYLQSPTIIIFKVSDKLEVTRVVEGLAPGPLVGLSGGFIDSHTLGEAVDFIIGDEKGKPVSHRDVVKVSLENMGGVVEYRNFFHMDGRKGKGSYIDMTNLASQPAGNNCEAFEFSMPDEVVVKPRKDGGGNYLFARVGKMMYEYKIHKISSDGFLDKTLTVTELNSIKR